MRRPKLKPTDFRPDGPLAPALLGQAEEAHSGRADRSVNPRTVRSIFLSDIHLGTRACQAERLLCFLRHHESSYLYLVGDIVDFWAMSRSIHWSRNQNTVVQKLLKCARHGTRVIFVPGNHDEVLEHHDGRMELIHWIAESPQTANPQPERLLQAVGAE